MKTAVVTILLFTLPDPAGGQALPFSTPPAWHHEAFGVQKHFGASIASAGDCDGDGYGDLVIGAPETNYDSGGGYFNLYFGSATGLSENVYKLWNENQVGAELGASVTCAGDLDGDGLDDIAAGSPMFSGNEPRTGRVQLFFGRENKRLFEDWKRTGFSGGDHLGTAVAGVGDVNGDGRDDLVVGADNLLTGGVRRGGIFLIAGRADRMLDFSWTYAPDEGGSGFGAILAGMGDVDGDGYNDVVVGAPDFAVDGSVVGAAYVFFGGPDGLGDAPGITLTGTAADAGFGTVLAMADVDGDGLSDVLAGAPLEHDASSGDLGRVYVYRSLGAERALSGALVMQNGNDRFGTSVANLGDVDLDGSEDVAVGTVQAFTTQPRQVAYVYLGSSSGLSTAPVQSLSLPATSRPTRSMGVVAGAGDVNGDGFVDLAIGNPTLSTSVEGEAWVFHGVPGRRPFLSYAARSWSAPARAKSTAFGWRADNAGDVDGDGWPDLLITAPLDDEGGEDAGAAFVFAGGRDGWGDDLLWSARGETAGEWFGQSGAGVGDVDGDGYADVAIGAPHASGRTVDEGAVFVYRGGPGGLAEEAAFVARGGSRGAALGGAVAAAGDVNGDGYSDIAAGACGDDGASEDEGRVLVIYGNPHRLSNFNTWTVDSGQAGAALGTSVAGVGDVDGDGIGDIAAGAPYWSGGEVDEGAVFIYRGDVDGVVSMPYAVLEVDRAGALLGVSVAAAGDVNGDHFGDVLAGAGGNRVRLSDLGTAFVFFGRRPAMETTPGWRRSGQTTGGAFGSALVGLGDIDGDGYAEIAIADPRYSRSSARNCGQVSVFAGGPDGPHRDPTVVFTGETDGEALGRHVAAAGDADADGCAELLASSADTAGVTWYRSATTRSLGLVRHQVEVDGRRELAVGAYSGSDNEMMLRVRVRPPVAAVKVLLEYQVREAFHSWSPVYSTGLITPTPDERRVDGMLVRDILIPVAFSNPNADWRVRMASSHPLHPLGRWFYHAHNATSIPTIRVGVGPDVPAPPDDPPPPAPAWRFQVEDPFPNPFNPDVTVAFTLPARARVRVTVFDVAGRMITRVADRTLDAGPNAVTWDGRAMSGARVASGVYFVRVEAVGQSTTRKLVVVR